MRRLLAVLCLLAVVPFMASPAFAHAHEARTSVEEPRAVPSAAPAYRSAMHIVNCRLAPTSVAASELRGDHHGHDHHLSGDHNPADHSHPPGEDILHQMMVHFTLDFASPADHLAPPASHTTSFETRFESTLSSGIAHVPPVPPPLG